jgi:hypothetical protein
MAKRPRKTFVHVNQHIIRRNKKTGSRDPVITVKTSDSNSYTHEVIIRDNSGQEVARVVYRPDKPLSCGATVWVEVSSDKGKVEAVDALDFQALCEIGSKH